MNTITPEPESPQPVKVHTIVKLVSRNVKVLKAIEVTPDKSVITITGANASGKSSLLDSILWVLRGAKVIPERPIREGQSKADVEMDLGEMIATLKITASGGPKLTLKATNGQDISSPATLLQNYSNPILLDPVGFVRLGETAEGKRKQAEMLRQLVGLDFTKLDYDRKRAYDERTLANRDLDNSTVKLGNYPFDKTAPAEEVKVSELMVELQKVQSAADIQLEAAKKHNQANGKVREHQRNVKNALDESLRAQTAIQKEIADIESLLKEKREAAKTIDTQLADTRKSLEKAVKEVEALVEQDEEAIRSAAVLAKKPIEERVTKADDINQKIRANRRHLEIKTEVEAASKKVTALTETINSFDKEKQDQLESAPFPLPDLAFDDSGIRYQGFPLSQAATAHQLKVVLAMGFAMKPRIPVVLFREYAVLDQASKNEITKMAEENHGQIWAEEVESADPSALVIENGELK